ncbi:MAG: DNA internalization-related competence protein ComEC/Rec2 [Candidatus Aminicenantes bacterium]|nr:MAG: DNA internalization-related competence protein ComEC/Rec2 [Candidatus Aminicenantes bacterium]
MSVCLICAWIFFSALRKTGLAFAFTLLTVFFLGSCLHTYQNNSFENNPLKNLTAKDYIDFQGRLYKSPTRGHERDYLFLKVEKISYDNREVKTHGNLRISVLHTQEMVSSSDLNTHDRIKVSAKLSPSQGYRNFKPSTMAQYLKSQNIHNRAFTKSPMLVEKLRSGKKASLPRIISILRRKLQRGIEHHFYDPRNSRLSSQGAVVEALLLGERGRMDPEISGGLQDAGIFHLFAISGAHIAIISFFLFSFFRFLRIPDRANYILLIFFLLLYASLVEGRPSVMRATIMALALLIGKLIWRKVSLLNTLGISAFILLMLNPFNLFSIGFQLTFAATLSIILFFPKIINYLPRLPLRVSEIFALSLTAQMGVLPFVALAFNRITFSALLLNFAAIPVVALIMLLGYMFLLFALISPLAAGILAKLIHSLVTFLIATSHLLDPIPGISFRIPTPSFFIVLGYFFFLGLLLLPTRIRRQKLFISICLTIFLGLLVTHPFPSHSKTLKLTFIDVGQGESILVEFPGHKKMLVDGGGTPEDTFDIGERIVSPFLWQKGIKKIHYLLLTHAHPDHMNGLKAVAKNFKIEEFWEAFSPKDNPSYAELRKRLSPKTTCRRMFRGQEEQIDGVKIEILNPIQANPFVSKILNDESLVLRISYRQTAFLLASDIGKAVEKELLQSSFTLQSDVLKSPHHGSDSSSSVEFLSAVAPQILIISVGAGNRYNLPNPVVINRYRKAGAQIYRTDHTGAVEISSDGQNLSLRTAFKSR